MPTLTASRKSRCALAMLLPLAQLARSKARAAAAGGQGSCDGWLACRLAGLCGWLECGVSAPAGGQALRQRHCCSLCRLSRWEVAPAAQPSAPNAVHWTHAGSGEGAQGGGGIQGGEQVRAAGAAHRGAPREPLRREREQRVGAGRARRWQFGWCGARAAGPCADRKPSQACAGELLASPAGQSAQAC